MSFGERIRQLREKHGFNQSYIAKYLQVSQVSVSNWERGIKQPSYQVLIDLAALYSVSCDYILGVTENAKRY